MSSAASALVGLNQYRGKLVRNKKPAQYCFARTGSSTDQSTCRCCTPGLSAAEPSADGLAGLQGGNVDKASDTIVWVRRLIYIKDTIHAFILSAAVIWRAQSQQGAFIRKVAPSCLASSMQPLERSKRSIVTHYVLMNLSFFCSLQKIASMSVLRQAAPSRRILPAHLAGKTAASSRVKPRY